MESIKVLIPNRFLGASGVCLPDNHNRMKLIKFLVMMKTMYSQHVKIGSTGEMYKANAITTNDSSSLLFGFKGVITMDTFDIST